MLKFINKWNTNSIQYFIIIALFFIENSLVENKYRIIFPWKHTHKKTTFQLSQKIK